MKYLALAGGTLSFYALLGYMVKHKELLEEIEEISGASSGSILGFLLLSGKNPSEIFDMTINLDFSPMIKVDLKTFLTSFGFIGHDLIKEKLIELWGGNPTFKQLPKKFHVSAYCLNTLEVEYFSSDTHPNMHVVEAICASMSIPIMFSAYEYKGKRYTDGATNELMPLLPFLGKNSEDIIALEVASSPVSQPPDLTTLVDYLKCVCLTGMKNRHSYNIPTIQFNAPHINTFDLRGPIEDRLRLFMIGFSA
jgi:NTE family protein